jgi:hypothetical protein
MKILKGSKILLHDTTRLVCDIIGKLLSNVVGHINTMLAYYSIIESNKLSIGLVWFDLKPTTIWNVKMGRRFSDI